MVDRRDKIKQASNPMAKSNTKSQKKEAKSSKTSVPSKGVTAKAASASKSAPKKVVKTILKTVAKKMTEKVSAVVKGKPVSAKPVKAGVKPPLKSTISELKVSASSKTSAKVEAKVAEAKVDAKTLKRPESKGESKPIVGGDKTPIKKSTIAGAEAISEASKSPGAAAKSAAKAPTKKKSTDKKDEFALEDDLVGETEDFVSDELSEYQAELESAVEEVDEKEVVAEEATIPVSAGTSFKEKSGEVVLTDAEGRRYCRVKDCDQVESVDAYCRYHYLLLWKKIQVRKKILTDGKLERYVEELTSRYPDKFLEVIRRDLRTEKDFVSAIQEMEIDESSPDTDFEDESSNFIDEVRSASNESLVEDDEY